MVTLELSFDEQMHHLDEFDIDEMDEEDLEIYDWSLVMLMFIAIDLFFQFMI